MQPIIDTLGGQTLTPSPYVFTSYVFSLQTLTSSGSRRTNRLGPEDISPFLELVWAINGYRVQFHT